MKSLTVAEYMTQSVHSINPEQPLAEAHALMRMHAIRHLPVLQGSELVGLVSMGDLHLLETLPGVEQFSATVEEAMTTDPYLVERQTPLAEVAREMARRRLGAALVLEGGEVVGVFTAVDALRALGDLASGQFESLAVIGVATQRETLVVRLEE